MNKKNKIEKKMIQDHCFSLQRYKLCYHTVLFYTTTEIESLPSNGYVNSKGEKKCKLNGFSKNNHRLQNGRKLWTISSRNEIQTLKKLAN